MPDGAGGGGDAYGWAGQTAPRPLPVIPRSKSPDRSGIDGALDEAVQWTLEKTGALQWLQKVTGMPELLTEAAEEWRSQALEMQQVAADLRSGAAALSARWEGAASDSFGRHMGELVGAVDATAEDLGQTAVILGQAAAECALAEETVIHLISELIDLLLAQLATSFILDLVTAGLATVVDALASGAEVAVYLERIAKVSEELANTLRKLMDAVKELREARAAGKSVEEIKEARAAVRAAAKGLRQAGGIRNPEKLGGRDWLAHHLLVGQIREHTLGLAEHEAGMENDWKEPVKEFATSDTGRRAVTGDGSEAPAPYHVDRDGIERAFG